ncbi:uncharacterized protein A4U43_C07F12450 [Asparagus officinalis]|uniref:RRM domain-containing protein n=1 Tax=Asparagus officinalis TaxID=4686 RepID=A0A5P1EBG6_ASPOF|nr:uncharacterized protein A4U43_C07F12450 [Asparagus officinalis]
MIYPITKEVLHQVFSPYGFVEKIVILQETVDFQALIQFQSHQNAVDAMNSLQGRNIYDGCCRLAIQISNFSEEFQPSQSFLSFKPMGSYPQQSNLIAAKSFSQQPNSVNSLFNSSGATLINGEDQGVDIQNQINGEFQPAHNLEVAKSSWENRDAYGPWHGKHVNSSARPVHTRADSSAWRDGFATSYKVKAGDSCNNGLSNLSLDDKVPLVDEDVEVKCLKRLEAFCSRKPYGGISEDGSGCVSILNSDLSPRMRSKNVSVDDLSLPRRKQNRLLEVDVDLSPLRRRKGVGDDLSPPRRNRNQSPDPGNDLSSPRSRQRLVEVSRRGVPPSIYLSPPRRRKKPKLKKPPWPISSKRKQKLNLSAVEENCAWFVDDRRQKLKTLIGDKTKWSSFHAFWLGIDRNIRWHMSKDKANAILKVVMKHFFIEKEVASTLVMDSLYIGLKVLKTQSKRKKTEVTNEFGTKHLNFMEPIASSSRPEISLQISSEILDRPNLAVDSPCWKRASMSQKYLFGSEVKDSGKGSQGLNRNGNQLSQLTTISSPKRSLLETEGASVETVVTDATQDKPFSPNLDSKDHIKKIKIGINGFRRIGRLVA